MNDECFSLRHKNTSKCRGGCPFRIVLLSTHFLNEQKRSYNKMNNSNNSDEKLK